MAGLGALAAGACVPVPARPTPQAAPSSTPELDAWHAEARGMLLDALQTLRTFDVFAAYRVSRAPESAIRLPSTLAWDPPTSAAWDNATHVARSLHGRADRLVLTVTTTQIDPRLWRERRSAADAAQELLGLADGLQAYRDRVDRLPTGDAAGAVGLLDKAWEQWDGTAARWGMSRAEPIGCAS
jgi:hypothetical protein